MYAIIECGGKQHKVSEGDVLKVEKVGKKAGESFDLTPIFISNNDEFVIGDNLKKAKVTAEILNEEIKAKKIIIYKMKRRKNSNKKVGHRQKHTRIKITKIAIS